MAEIWHRHGPLTGLLNNAAANFIAPTASLSPRAFDAVTSTVMTGSFNTTLAVGRRWIAEGLPGSVLSNLTTWVWSGSAFVVPSAMAKAAVHAMTMSLAVEWGRYGIRLNALAPGPIPTEYAWEMLNPTDKSSVGATQSEQIPLGRPGTIDELANLTIFAFSDACDYLTGETIAMDGGQRLAGPNTFAGLTAMTRRGLGGRAGAQPGGISGGQGRPFGIADRATMAEATTVGKSGVSRARLGVALTSLWVGLSSAVMGFVVDSAAIVIYRHDSSRQWLRATIAGRSSVTESVTLTRKAPVRVISSIERR